MGRTLRVFLGLAVLALAPVVALGQGGMPNPAAMSGVPLPVPDLPAGSLSVRVMQGNFDRDLAAVSVVFDIDGRTQTKVTDAGGRAELSGLATGARVRASVVVEGERVESQVITIGSSGIRVMLVVSSPGSVPGEAGVAGGPVERGTVVIGSESRVIAELSDDRLNIFYMLDVINGARDAVDIGGPLVFELPREARGASVLDGSTAQATANGPRVTVTGPFLPGTTLVQIGYELPYSGALARIDQVWPARLEQVNFLAMQFGAMTVTSAQLSSSRSVVDQGQALIVGMGPAIEAGRALVLEIDGLPHHPVWPRNTALTLAGAIVAIGLWAAFVPGGRRPARFRRA